MRPLLVKPLVALSVLGSVTCVEPRKSPDNAPPPPPSPAASVTKPSVSIRAVSPPPPDGSVQGTRSSDDASSSDAASDATSTPQIPDDMLGVPGGLFTMGQDDKGEQDERPAHKVRLRPFLLDKTEVTNEAYGRCVDAGRCNKADPRSSEANHFGKDASFRTPRRPVSSISQTDASAYCASIGRRLPTEAEWEHAARGFDGRLFPWGNDTPTKEHGVFSASITQDVGTHPKGAGPFGHLDLAGNVWEWVSDFYDPYAYRRDGAADGIVGTCDQILQAQRELKQNKQQGFTGSNPIPDECEYVLRGGAFNYPPMGLRSSNRVHHPGRFRLIMSGFRCAKDWPDGPVRATP